MSRRLFWIGVGAAATVMALRWIQRQRARYGPGNVADRLAEGTRDLATLVKVSLAEGRRAMAEREAELRSGLASPQG